jgi:very-short-patch-repair endonuclease
MYYPSVGTASVTVYRHSDVVRYVTEEIGKGAALGAIYHQPPPVEDLIDGLTLALARHVRERQSSSAPVPKDRWMESARHMISTGQLPLPEGYSAETNVDRLIRWADPQCQRVFIGLTPELDSPTSRRIQVAAEWMNRSSGLPVSVVSGDGSAIAKNGAFRSDLEESLARRLERDPEMRGLFQSNTPVATVFDTKPRVDFVWRTGRLIVEIDSYFFHKDHDHFTGDRQRDYETGATGYVTLRLTDAELRSDPELAVQKIRRFVHLRKSLFHV